MQSKKRGSNLDRLGTARSPTTPTPLPDPPKSKTAKDIEHATLPDAALPDSPSATKPPYPTQTDPGFDTAVDGTSLYPLSIFAAWTGTCREIPTCVCRSWTWRVLHPRSPSAKSEVATLAEADLGGNINHTEIHHRQVGAV